jgi:preprotein translocase subunit YajC
MSLLMSTAFAADTAATTAHPQSMMSTLIFILVFFGIFYFLLIRPQSKRQKELRSMLNNLSTGDEVVTSGGIMGKIKEISDQSITLEIAENISVRIQRNAVAMTLPKGTLGS